MIAKLLWIFNSRCVSIFWVAQSCATWVGWDLGGGNPEKWQWQSNTNLKGYGKPLGFGRYFARLFDKDKSCDSIFDIRQEEAESQASSVLEGDLSDGFCNGQPTWFRWRCVCGYVRLNCFNSILQTGGGNENYLFDNKIEGEYPAIHCFVQGIQFSDIRGLQKDGHSVKIVYHAEYRDWVEGHGVVFALLEGNPASWCGCALNMACFRLHSSEKSSQNSESGWMFFSVLRVKHAEDTGPAREPQCHGKDSRSRGDEDPLLPGFHYALDSHTQISSCFCVTKSQAWRILRLHDIYDLRLSILGSNGGTNQLLAGTIFGVAEHELEQNASW